MPVNELIARGIETADPAGSYAQGRVNALRLHAAEQEAQQAPIDAAHKQRVNALQLQTLEQGLRKGQADLDENAQKAVNHYALALWSLPEAERPGAYAHIAPQLNEKFGLGLSDTWTPQVESVLKARLGNITPEQASSILMAELGGHKSDSEPSAIQNYKYYSKLSPDDRATFSEANRGSQVKDFGGYVGIVNPVAGTVTNVGSKTLAPGDQPAVRGAQAAASAYGSERAKADVDKQQKLPAQRGLEYLFQQLAEAQKKVATGGPMGARGKISRIEDSQDANRFNNLREQISTEMRTIFRIPGEGTLSDREMAQYGIQLPSLDYDAEVNAQIAADILQRVGLRTGVPTGGGDIEQLLKKYGQ